MTTDTAPVPIPPDTARAAELVSAKRDAYEDGYVEGFRGGYRTVVAHPATFLATRYPWPRFTVPGPPVTRVPVEGGMTVEWDGDGDLCIQHDTGRRFYVFRRRHGPAILAAAAKLLLAEPSPDTEYECRWERGAAVAVRVERGR